MGENGFDLVEIDAAGTARIIEYKKFIPSKQSFVATVASIANSGGGTIFIGADEKSHAPVGLKFADEKIGVLKKAIEEQLNLKSPQVDLNVIEDQGRKLIRVDIVKPPDVVLDKKDGAVYEYKEGKEVRLPVSEAKEKILSSNDSLAPIIGKLIESNDNLMRELRYSNSWRGQWKKLLITSLSSALIPLIIFFLTTQNNRRTEDRREEFEARKLASEVRPFIETSIKIDFRGATPIPAKADEASNFWKDLLFENNYREILPTKVAYVSIFNHGKGKAIEVNVPVIVKVWGLGKYTQQMPYQFFYEFSFRSLDPAQEVISKEGINVTFFPNFRIEKMPLRVIGLPEVNATHGLEFEVNREYAIESGH